MGKIDQKTAQRYFEGSAVVAHYEKATANIGLWESEEIVFRRCFTPAMRLLELGSGAGRIAFGMHELGFRNLLGVELSKPMLKRARQIAQILEYPVPFVHGDATGLQFEDALFDGAIFGFNGLMQIPGRANRRRALAEIHRVVCPGGRLVFTTHDRELPAWRTFWQEEQARWDYGHQDPALHEFGDRWEDTEMGRLYIHIPVREEILADLRVSGWRHEEDILRSDLALEQPQVRAFSDECRFWIARK
jgi:SAM-dependent methyltransferase